MRYHNILVRDFRTVKNNQVINFNIGTTAHCPGTLAVLKKYLPETLKFTVWADAPLETELADMMNSRFPDVEIVCGDLAATSPAALLKAVDNADLFLVSSGAGIAAPVLKSLEQFQARTGKAAGAYGIGCTPSVLARLDHMEFAWLRDPLSAEIARNSRCPVKGFAPDAVFDFDIADEKNAAEFMKKYELVPGKFICCIPGQRHTPRWQFFDTPANPEKIAENQHFAEHDNTPLRKIIELAVTKYHLKVLICPEQITEIALIRPLIFDRLPAEIQKACVPMDEFWSPDLALGVYRASLGVFGVEMHSQVMAVGNNVPGVLLRHPQFGSKSEMWKTIGLEDWLIHTELPDYCDRAVQTVDRILGNPDESAQKLRRARTIIDQANRQAIGQSFC